MQGYRLFGGKCLPGIISLIFLNFSQTWRQSMLGNDSFAWNHVVVWSSDAITQSFHLHFYDPQLYSGELLASIQTVELLSHF